MASIRWLHLTDFHIGSEIPKTWPAMRAQIDADLAKIHSYAEGPFDIVLFTGDLVQTGKADEYARLDEVLDRLWETLKKHGSEPVLLAVPGNHDLVRPDAHVPAARSLIHWKDEPELADIFWHDAKGRDYREVVTNAFRPYTEWVERWRKRHPLPSWVRVREDGKIPGDFVATVERDGIKLGILGLNSTFLQLAKSVGVEDLILDPLQFNALCDNDPQAWAEQHDLSLLMTHHPPEWLAQSAMDHYKNSIYVTDWFFGHLCGHLHIARAEERRIGGAPTERLFQGTALLGEQQWENLDGKHFKRIVGYGAARIERKNENFELRLWPRIMKPRQDGRDTLGADDQSYRLDDDRSVGWPLRVRASSKHPPIASLKTGSRAPEPPGRGYSRDWYVAPPPRDRESKILANLAEPGALVMLTAPPLFGKSTFLQRIIGCLREEDASRGKGGLVLVLDLGVLSEQAPETTENCLHELAELVVEKYKKEIVRAGGVSPDSDNWVEEAWKRPSTPDRKFSALLEKNILSGPYDRIVLVIDRFDRLGNNPASLALARLLRTFFEEAQQGDERWSKVRTMLATTGSHALLRTRVDAVSELLNVVGSPYRLESFGLHELTTLQALYEVKWSEDHLKQLLTLTGGWPYLSRQILYLAATGISADELLDPRRLIAEHCSLQLQQLWLHVCEYEQLRRVVCALLEGAPLERDDAQILRDAGLVRHNAAGTGYEMMSKLVETYFKERCRGTANRGSA